MTDYADVSISIIFIARSKFFFAVSPRLLAGDSRLTISNSPTSHFISREEEHVYAILKLESGIKLFQFVPPFLFEKCFPMVEESRTK